MIFHSDLALQDDPRQPQHRQPLRFLHFLPFVFVQSSHETSSLWQAGQTVLQFLQIRQMPQAPLPVQWLPGCAFVAANLLISFVFFCRVVMLFKMRAETACNSEFLDACTNQHKSLQTQLNGCLTNEPSPLCCWSKGECLRWSAWWLGWLGQEPHMESQDTWSQSWFECNRKFGFYSAWKWTRLAAWRQNHRVTQNKEVRPICRKQSC